MNGQQHRDDIVARWIDDGPEAAPERFVWAALEQVDRTPQRSAWRVALENMPMYAKLAIPLAGAAAILIAAVLAFGAVNGPSQVGDSPSPSATEAPPTDATAEPTPSSSAAACGVTPDAGALHVVWCVTTAEDPFTVDFTFDAPEEWADQVYAGTEALYLVPPSGLRIAISRNGPDTIDAWRDELLAVEEFEVTEPQPITIDGVEGYVFDVRIADGVDPDAAPPVFEDSELDFTVGEGATARVWLVAFPDRALAIVTRAQDAAFEEWAGAVSDAIDTIVWAP